MRGVLHRGFDKVVFTKVRERFGGRLRFAISGGAALSREVAEFIDCLGITVYEGYGLTETSPVVAVNAPGARRVGSVGRPLPGVRVEIDRSVTGDEREGEIVVYGHCVMMGYHNLPEESAAVLDAKGGLHTGDLGCIDEQGFLHITGRIKERYKLENGKYVAPVPLEEKLKLSPYIVNVMVYGADRPYNVALVVPDFEALGTWASAQGIPTSDPKVLVQDARVYALMQEEITQVSVGFRSFDKIRKFVLIPDDFTVENDMLTPSLKIKRRVIMARYGAQLEALYRGG